MAIVLVAEIMARHDLRCEVLHAGTVTIFNELREAEEYCFSLGATAIASMKGRKGYLRATKIVEDQPVDSKRIAISISHEDHGKYRTRTQIIRAFERNETFVYVSAVVGVHEVNKRLLETTTAFRPAITHVKLAWSDQYGYTHWTTYALGSK